MATNFVSGLSRWTPGLIDPRGQLGINLPNRPQRFANANISQPNNAGINLPAQPIQLQQFGNINPLASPNLPAPAQPYDGSYVGAPAQPANPAPYSPIAEASPESRAAAFAPSLGRYRGRFGPFSKPMGAPSYGGGAEYSNFGIGGGMPGRTQLPMVPGMMLQQIANSNRRRGNAPLY